MTQRMSLHPANPTQGSTTTVSYDFEGSGLSSVIIEVTFDPNETTTPYTLVPGNNSVNVSVPENGTQMTIVDTTSTSDDLVRAVTYVPPITEDRGKKDR